MPFQSEAQRRLFHLKASRGELSEKTVSEWEYATKNKKKLPMHVKKAAVPGDITAPEPDVHRNFEHLTKLLREQGVYAGTAHKRLLIPKSKLTEQDLAALQFVPVTVAIPEAGQDRFQSYRHPTNLFHLHSHPEGWTMHEDRHPAATMLSRNVSGMSAKSRAMWQGLPHVSDEGIPGFYSYLKGQLARTGTTAERVLAELPPGLREHLNQLPNSPTYQEETKAAAYDSGAYNALYLFHKSANIGVNPAPVVGSAVTQATSNIHPYASRLSNALVGGATGAILNATMAPSGDRLRQGGIGLVSDAIGGALGPWGMAASPAINVALQHFTAPKEEKQADHADDRLKERIKAEFPADTLTKLRSQAANLHLAPGQYYLPLKNKAGNIAAVAAFKTVGPEDRLILATILTPKKHPPTGTSLSHLLKQPYTKVAATAEEDTEDNAENHTARNITMTAAGAAPWLGTLGQRPMHKAPHFTDPKKLLQLAQPGDVWLTADTKPTGNKALISFGTGTPEGYHAGVVDSPHAEHVIHYNADTGLERDTGGKSLTSDGHFTLFRPNLNDTERTEFLERLRGQASTAEEYGKTQGNKARKALLSTKETARAAINELLIPKTDSPETATKAQAVQHQAMQAFKLDPTNKPHAATCSGGVAAALPLGKHIIPGKAPERVVPSDFYRSKLLTPIGHYRKKPRTNFEKVLQHGPTASRLLLGGALAGGTYGLSKLLSKKHKKPAATSDGTKDAAQHDSPTDETSPETSTKMPAWKQHLLHYAVPSLAGLGTYALARTQRFSSNPAIADLQRRSKGRLTLLDDNPNNPSPWTSAKMKLFRGADDVRVLNSKKLKNETKTLRNAVQQGTPLPEYPNVKHIRGAMFNQGSPAHSLRYTADADPTSNVRNITRIGDDKLYEGQLWNKHAPGAMPETYGSVLDIAPDIFKHPEDTRPAKLQAHLRKKYPAGFILKPRNDSQLGDNLLTHRDDFQELLLQPEGKGKYLRKMLAKPDEFIAQEALPLAHERKMPGYARIDNTHVPIEYRVHALEGQVIPELTDKRWLGIDPRSHSDEIAKMHAAVQKHLDTVPTRYNKGTTLGLDVAQLEDGTHRIIETNPGGQSGYLMPDYSKIPTLIGHRLYRTITGRDSPAMAGAKGLAAAGGAYGLIRANDYRLRHKKQEQEDVVEPN